MENFWSGPIVLILVIVLLVLIFKFVDVQYRRNAESEIARYEHLTNDNCLTPVHGKLEYQHSTGEFGSLLRIFKSGRIIFTNGLCFVTDNERAFKHIIKNSLAKNPKFIMEYEDPYSSLQ